ncbi:STAS/SEC14 domain-containing protein [Bowmanella dokdonensis]|uniref:STAS/SEC14 domain-containing protein n=1 Tax=Bowmanella dokdonensis TaxID=751969 RepID=A0A939IQZ0_9ALTE|nr:STAS/SEC14 domain-containing protein [Bowmanella dokdonensis]MBN7825092.1 STAS/SEC14 domain-containing protein [Bowmanella dokdonensis]
MFARFASHGDYQVDAKGLVITLNVSGPWNHEAALEFLQEAEQIVLDMQGQRFGCLVSLDNQWFATPDAYRELRKLTEWAITQGLSREAIVTDSALVAELVGNWIVPAQSETFEKQVFKQKELALAWLSEKFPV